LDEPTPVRRYQRQRAGELLHLDVKKLARFERIGHRITGNRRGASQGLGYDFFHVAIDDAFSIGVASGPSMLSRASSQMPGSLLCETHFQPARNVPETAPELAARRWRSTYSQELTMATLIRKWRQARQYRRYRMTVERLTALSSGELRDLGIAPWDIDRLARKAAQR
jgi:uncharacterized protein YjiS (DUF1127 family)